MKLDLVIITNLKGGYFKFRTKIFENYTDYESSFEVHIEELRQRFFQIIAILCNAIIFTFLKVNFLVELLEKPVSIIKFIQLSPGDYLISTIKISIYGGILLCSPIFLSQIIFFTFPGLILREKKLISLLLIISFLLFIFGIFFSYSVLIPAALKFFIDYSLNIIEPLWSFDQYLDFILLVFYSTGLAFQIPVVQIIFGISGILSGKKMLSIWKYVFLGSTIVGAVLTPSVDPITQLCLSGAIFLLYLLGTFLLLIFEK